jgi:acyl transferase domain-containing protein
LLLAASALREHSTAPVKHLQSINPYVAAAISDWRRLCGLTAAIPLQPAPGVFSGADALQHGSLAGTSSFGMSGVNAHALVAQPMACTSGPAGSNKVGLFVQQQRSP